MLKNKEIQMLVEKSGLNFKEWKEETIKVGRLAIIDKDGDEYKLWEQSLLERHAIQLVINNMNETKNSQKSNEHNKPVETKQSQPNN
ncbi:hypothetical protein RW115_12025 [Macrococcus capreoli]